MQDQRAEQADEALEQLLQQPGAVPLQGRTGGPLQGFEVPGSALAAGAIDHIEELSDLGADGVLDHPQRFT